MKKEQIGFFVTLILGGAAAYYFLVYKPNKNNSTQLTLLYLQNKAWSQLVATNPEISAFKANYFGSDAFNNMAFLTAWGSAIDNKMPTFYYGGMTYNTLNGVAN
jgi:hypothetical protein